MFSALNNSDLNNSNSESFEQIISKHINKLYNFALRLTQDADNANDLLQESCLTAFENYYQLKDVKKIKPWLFQILHRKFLNNYRGKKDAPLIDIELTEELLTDSDDFFNIKKIENMVGDEIYNAFYTLPVEFREIILLADNEDLSYKEISEILNIPMGTIASRLYRGHKLLKEKLWHYAQNLGYKK